MAAPLKVLMLCDLRPNHPATTHDYVESFARFSNHEFRFYCPVLRPFPEWLNLEDFDVLLLHYGVYLGGDYYLDDSWRRAIAAAKIHKGLFIQDEYRRIDELCQRKRQLGIDFIFTCWPLDEAEHIYTADRVPGVKLHNVLTGYVPEVYELDAPDFESERRVDVSYRARGEGTFYWLGELFQDKVRLATEFRKRAADYPDLVFDVSAREEDRIYGEAWPKFLKSSRCTLGAESGASVVDFTGRIEREVRAYCDSHPGATFSEVRDLLFPHQDGRYRMNQVSPRIFEAIGCGCGLVLIDGTYSGVVEPDEHFIPLRRDYSNFGEVIERIRDVEGVVEMARRAYAHVIGSRKWSYEAFVAHVDSVLIEAVATPPAGPTEELEPLPPTVPKGTGPIRRARMAYGRVATKVWIKAHELPGWVKRQLRRSQGLPPNVPPPMTAFLEREAIRVSSEAKS